MPRQLILLCVMLPMLFAMQCAQPADNTIDPPLPLPPLIRKPVVRIATSRGVMEAELYPVQAPLSVANFQRYLYEGFYDNTRIESTAAEGLRLGRLAADGTAKTPTHPVIKNESDNGLPNRRGYLAMIERNGDGSAQAEFVVYTGEPSGAAGRAVFGRIVSGLDVADTIVQANDPGITLQRLRELDPNGQENNGRPQTLPALSVPPGRTGIPATGPLTTVSLGDVRAADYNGQSLVPQNDAPADGFAVGTTVVHWWVINSLGHVGTDSQTFEVTARKAGNPRVRVYTSTGDMTLELFPEFAPLSVDNFLKYVRDGFYNGLIWHRVIPDFIAQTGGVLPDGSVKPVGDAVVNESSNRIKNDRGTVALARTSDPDSATSQFYINLKNNDSLNYVGVNQPGYAVFGTVIEGIETVDRIGLSEVDEDDRPLPDVYLYGVEVAGEESPTITTPSGLQYKDFVVGTGATPGPDATVVVDYVGTLQDWTEFDRGNETEFALDGVVEGFAEGISTMRVGGTRRLIIPPELGYGANPPANSDIPPNATLVFVVTLISFE